MATADFSWNAPKQQFILAGGKESGQKLSDEILIDNIRWFTIFRWAVIGALILFQIVALIASDALTQLGIRNQQDWPLVLSVILSAANFAYIYALDFCQPSKFNSPSINIWVQIIVDLLCLSIVVHNVGSTTTPAPFFYILHIALACIFFSALEGLFVAIIVSAMYTIVLLIENQMFFQVSQSILIDSHFSNESLQKGRALVWMIALNTLFFIVWYVVSRLTLVVRKHEQYLRDAYEQINQAQIAKDQYAMLVTHQLKAPLDAIRSKINLIKGGYCGHVSSEIEEVLTKIDRRGHSMSNLILDVLKLERLKTAGRNNDAMEYVDISATIYKCIDKLKPVTTARNIEIKLSIQNFFAWGIPDQIEILFENIIANAITYSYDDAAVDINSIVKLPDNSAILTISDHGIGIEAKDLPNIFNEYFYSPRAVMHNQSSSGIGLSLVKIAAVNNNLQLKVTSDPGLGTAFSVIFPNIRISAGES
ncbi:HAMP domain-containing sensor histidine kinase [Nitrosomonas sp. Is37]|uniref:sensor histidine kinase n=1 Tax=Nitrosomonas sp. Is37 TaxID=3080535 RepID=UPI00294B7708|nr:HAMP domain-containing sensor histidine kinase [Nitrosomonas sp. Is37]MDV6345599.1 HAMP domain-containing sensor histidine kinase [Nitrosomonas sp. Is37]